MTIAKHDFNLAFPGAKHSGRAIAVAVGALVLTACLKQQEPPESGPPPSSVATTASALTASGPTSTYSAYDVQTAYDRAQRIRDLLANCSGAAAPAANAEANTMAQAQTGLGNILAGITANTAANRDQAVAAMLAAQANAYNAAVACRLVAPGVPDPGGWSATWDDISS